MWSRPATAAGNMQLEPDGAAERLPSMESLARRVRGPSRPRTCLAPALMTHLPRYPAFMHTHCFGCPIPLTWACTHVALALIA